MPLFVALQMAQHLETFATMNTMKIVRGPMDFHVIVPAASRMEIFLANFARERAIEGVRSLMGFQLMSDKEFTRTLVAFVRP